MIWTNVKMSVFSAFFKFFSKTAQMTFSRPASFLSRYKPYIRSKYLRCFSKGIMKSVPILHPVDGQRVFRIHFARHDSATTFTLTTKSSDSVPNPGKGRKDEMGTEKPAGSRHLAFGPERICTPNHRNLAVEKDGSMYLLASLLALRNVDRNAHFNIQDQRCLLIAKYYLS
jgi:hypothetical protein